MMNVFKRKSIQVAVLAGLGAVGVTGTASAVHVNPDGLGQVLIYPYYTVRTAATSIASGQYNTYVSVTNTTASYKAVKVRFKEGMNSQEVLDFNLFLSPHDVWTGSVEPTATGAMLVSADKSCTTGVIPAAGQPFSNLQYSSTRPDGETTSLDRTREGYIEMIEMGDINAVAGLGASLRTAVLHNSSGVPPCTAATLAAADLVGLTGYLSVPTGGLMGSASLVNPATGVDYTMDAVALGNFDATVGGIGSTSTSLSPTLESGSVTTSDIFNGNVVSGATWVGLSGATAQAEAVSAAIMRNAVINEFVLDSGTASATDWVVTFPTKNLFVGIDTLTAGARNHTLAFNPFNENFGLGGACDNVGLTVYSREEQTIATSGGFSPSATVVPQLCWESNVITFNQASSPLTSAILGSTNVNNINTSYQNGYVQLSFAQARNVLTPIASTTNNVPDLAIQSTHGLPVVGFMVQDFVNSTLVTGAGATPGAAFGGNFAHKYTRDVR